jgi:ectoine hydroxylase-related dioxygenase (phytanoyl-CoA dioxygenase family)
LLFGSLRFVARGETPPSSYQSLISLFCQSGGASNDWLARLVSLLHPPYRLDDADGVLGNLVEADLDRVKRQLDERGYYVFERRLPDDLCDRLLHFALSHECRLRPMQGTDNQAGSLLVDRFPRKRPGAVRYDFDLQAVIDNADVQRLMADRSIVAVSQRYLRCRPIVDVMTMWWHTAFSNQPDPDAAQFWHFDMDRIKWLKFFVYLTDVGPENGPHSFVAGSHKTGGIPSHLLSRGYSRLTDEDVERCYSADRFIEFTGPRGTILAEDTRGLHKGKHVLKGDRLVLQLQFSNSLYGGTYEPTRFSRATAPELQAMVARYRRLYSNYAG